MTQSSTPGPIEKADCSGGSQNESMDTEQERFPAHHKERSMRPF